MATTVFPSPANLAQTTLGQAYTTGSGTMTLAAGYGATLAARISALGLPAISAAAPLRYAVFAGASLNAYGQVTNPALVAIYQATGLSGDQLTGVTVQEGTTDQAFNIGDSVYVLVTGGTLAALQAAINRLESGATGTNAVQLQGRNVSGTAPSDGQVLLWKQANNDWEPGTATAGTVTSVSLAMPGGFSVSGSPVTASGTFTVSTSLSGVLKGTGSALAAATAGTDFVAPGGVAGGQTIVGGTNAGDGLILTSTGSATKGTVQVGNTNGTDTVAISGLPLTVTPPAGGTSTTPFARLQGTGGTASQNGLEVSFTPNSASNAAHCALSAVVGAGYQNNSQITGVLGQAQSSQSSGGALVVGVEGFVGAGRQCVGTMGYGQCNANGGMYAGVIGGASYVNATTGNNYVAGGMFSAGGAFSVPGRIVGVYGEARPDSQGGSFGGYFRFTTANPTAPAIPTFSDLSTPTAAVVADCNVMTSAAGLRVRGAATKTATVTNKALTSNVATLTTSAAHGLFVGETVVVTGVDATFNGTWVITGVPSTTTFTYADVAANVSSQAGTGTATCSQTGNLFQVESSGGTLLAFFRPNGSLALPTLADSAAANNSLYFSSTTNQLAYKDSTGTLHKI